MKRIDSRAWIAWAVAAMLPALLGRNPIMLVELLGIVVVVHVVCANVTSFAGIRWFVRVAGAFSLIGVIVNVLTVHAGNSVFARLPERWPVIGGVLTLNALVYGVASGIALFTLVLIGTTVGSTVIWIDLFHALPRRLAPIAVAGSVAWTFLPQTAIAFQQIRESQEMRGHRVRGVRGALPLLVPLLAGALERALSTAEALEARGFGASLVPGGAANVHHDVSGFDRPSWGSRAARQIARLPERSAPILAIAALVLLISGAFSALTGHELAGWISIVLGAGMFGVVLRVPEMSARRRTSYRQSRWTGRDSFIVGSAGVAGVTTLLVGWIRPDALVFEPYPELKVPMADAPLMIAIALLLVPALMAPESDARESMGQPQ